MKKKKTKKPSKSRKRRFTAPKHLKRKYLSAPLSPSLKAEYGTRSMPLITGDNITVVKGDRKLSEGRIIRVNLEKSVIYIEGLTRNRMDGSTFQIPLKPNNVMITNLNLEDDWRKGIIERKSFSAQKEE
jgi:large subunit ribosomal protein L24